MLKSLDTALVFLFWAALIVLSVAGLVRVFRGKAMGYGQTALLPKSWLRWILDEKDPTQKRED
jgi:hypothetical protein